MRPTLILAAAASAAVLLTVVGQAQAQANRTFVSGSGSDANPCSLSAPCRSFAGAIAQTNAGGEIVVLDSAGYGSVTITKSISINAPDGIEGGVTVASGTAITVNTGAGDVVNLRGLTLVGGGVGLNGILFSNVGALNIQNCVIRGFSGRGLGFFPTGDARFDVSDTLVSNISAAGILIQPSGSAGVSATFNRVQAIDSGQEGFDFEGFQMTGGTLNATIANSVASNNSVFGVGVGSASSKAPIQVMVSNSVVSNNGTGVFEDGANATTYLAKNTIAGNGQAFSVLNNGALFSFGDNYIRSNGTDGGAIALVSTK